MTAHDETMKDIPCPFEKAITSNRCGCEHAVRFAIAESIGMACRSDPAQKNCVTLLALMRERSRFALKLTNTSEKLPFGKELQIMIGGLSGLQYLLMPAKAGHSRIENIHDLVRQAQEKYRGLVNLPYQELIKFIAHYKPKRRAMDDSS
jgi:hypothetical protein